MPERRPAYTNLRGAARAAGRKRTAQSERMRIGVGRYGTDGGSNALIEKRGVRKQTESVR